MRGVVGARGTPASGERRLIVQLLSADPKLMRCDSFALSHERESRTGASCRVSGVVAKRPHGAAGEPRYGLHAKEVAELEEEAVFGPAQTGETQLSGIREGAAVAGKEHRAGVRLVGKQKVAAERPVIERAG